VYCDYASDYGAIRGRPVYFRPFIPRAVNSFLSSRGAVVAENSSLLMNKDLHRLLRLLDSPIRSAICYSLPLHDSSSLGA